MTVGNRRCLHPATTARRDQMRAHIRDRAAREPHTAFIITDYAPDGVLCSWCPCSYEEVRARPCGHGAECDPTAGYVIRQSIGTGTPFADIRVCQDHHADMAQFITQMLHDLAPGARFDSFAWDEPGLPDDLIATLADRPASEVDAIAAALCAAHRDGRAREAQMGKDRKARLRAAAALPLTAGGGLPADYQGEREAPTPEQQAEIDRITAVGLTRRPNHRPEPASRREAQQDLHLTGEAIGRYSAATLALAGDTAPPPAVPGRRHRAA